MDYDKQFELHVRTTYNFHCVAFKALFLLCFDLHTEIKFIRWRRKVNLRNIVWILMAEGKVPEVNTGIM
jgi:hypothetical protein